nr:hypothetical protein [Jiangella rhizosphaerae]
MGSAPKRPGRWPVPVPVPVPVLMAVPRGTTADGFERHLGVNHLGPFALTGLLADRVRERVVTVSSGLHVLGRVREDLNWEHRRYQRWLAYAQSKLANLLFAYELQRRLAAAGRATTVSVSAHPGVAATEGQRRDTSLRGKLLAGGPAQGRAVAGTSRRSRDAGRAVWLWERSEELTGVRYALRPAGHVR